MEFELLLPDDDVPLETRAGGAVAVVPGIPLRLRHRPAVARKSELPGEVNEVLQRPHPHQPRQRRVETGADSRRKRRSLRGVVEYVRVGVQLIHDELIPAHAARTSRR